MCSEVPLPEGGQGPPRPTVGEIVRAHGAAYQALHALTEAQRKVLRDIGVCRTPVLGGRLEACETCGYRRAVFHSCRNRHCPGCQALPQARWVEGRLARLLPTDYFHVVFTVPDTLLNGLAMRNRRLFFDALFDAGSQTLLQLGQDPRRLGAQLGLTAVLHTWTRDLRFHPHLHCIVTGGGLTPDGARWRAGKRTFLFPVRVLSALFRGKLLAALDAAFLSDALITDGVEGFDDPSAAASAWKRLKRKLYATKWVSYAKQPFAGPEAVYRYLGQYTHRVGISNHRLLSATPEAVTFRTRGDATATLPPLDFLRRFLLHVLPRGFVKLRHYGLLAPGNVNGRLATARSLLGNTPHAALPVPTGSADPTALVTRTAAPTDWRALFRRLTGKDLSVCPVCKAPLVAGPLSGLERTPTPSDTS